MKVLLVSPLPPPVGGIATWTGLVLSAAKASEDLDVSLLNTAVRGRSIIAPSRFGRILVGGAQAMYVFISFLFRCLLRRPDVVHLCTPCDLGMLRDVPMAALSRVLGIPVVLHFHRGKVPDFPDLMKVPSLLRLLIVLSVKVANAVVVLNAPALKAINSRVRGRVIVVPNMVEVRDENQSFSNRDKARLMLLFVGHVVERKGIYDLVKACRLLSARGMDFELRVVGPVTDEVKKELEKLSDQAVPGQWLNVVGSRDAQGVDEEMGKASIFCLPSYAEGFPYVILEAMAKGLPIVTTNVGAMPEALAGGAGICLEPGEIESLATSLESLMENESSRSYLGAKAQCRCKELYSKEAVFATVKRLWASVV